MSVTVVPTTTDVADAVNDKPQPAILFQLKVNVLPDTEMEDGFVAPNAVPAQIRFNTSVLEDGYVKTLLA